MNNQLPKNLPACVSRRVLLSSGAVMSFATAMTLAGCSSNSTDAKSTATATKSATADATASATATATASNSESATTTATQSAASTPAGDKTIPAGTKVIALTDLPENTAKVVKIGEVGVLVARNSGETVVAFNAICTHKFVADVAVNGKVATCPAHDSEFNAFTGAVEEGPAENPLATIAVKVDAGIVVTA